MLEAIPVMQVDKFRPFINGPKPPLGMVWEKFMGNDPWPPQIKKLRDSQLQIDRGVNTHAQFELSMARDPKFIRRLDNLPVGEAVQIAFKCILGREPDAREISLYTRFIKPANRRTDGSLLIENIINQPETTTRYVTKLYQELFGREPDAEGLAIYVDKARAPDMSGSYCGINGVARDLKRSEEYYRLAKAKRKEMTLKVDKKREEDWKTKEFSYIDYKITQLYIQCYGQEPNLQALPRLYKLSTEILADKLTLAEVKHMYANSPTFELRMRDFINKYPDQLSAVVQDIYGMLLGRNADKEGMRIYEDQLRKGRNLAEVINEISHSQEYGNTLVNDLYHEILLRDPDPKGLKIYSDKIKSGAADAGQVAQELRKSQEAIEVQKSYINEDGIRMIVQS